jgi:NADH-quinone oxidoreductase subunit A
MVHSLHLAQQMPDPRTSWAPVVLMIIIGLLFAVGSIVLSRLIGPRRTGAVKAGTYESGMVPVGDTRQRFNVRFYLVAIIFVAFDVEVVIMYPWATAFAPALTTDPALGTLMLVGISIFVMLLLIGYIYDWGKGVLRWD